MRNSRKDLLSKFIRYDFSAIVIKIKLMYSLYCKKIKFRILGGVRNDVRFAIKIHSKRIEKLLPLF
jgi:hypothetical protein